MGLLKTQVDWAARASVCEGCPLMRVKKGVSYCGTPYLQQIDRDLVTEGCGCPTRQKAKSPEEHCPIDSHHRAATQLGGNCTCKWCAVKSVA